MRRDVEPCIKLLRRGVEARALTGGLGCRRHFSLRNAFAVAPSLLSGCCTLWHILGPLCTQVARPCEARRGRRIPGSITGCGTGGLGCRR